MKKIKSFILRLDLIKSYDRVNWGFLRLVLLQIGLILEATNWILDCVSSTNFEVLFNGEPSDFFRSTRCLRQECQLSPFSFLSYWRA